MLMLVTAGCEDPAADRISLRLTDNVLTWPMDLNPATPATGVDNGIGVTIEFESTFGSQSIEWSQYQVQYSLGTELSPFIAGPLTTSQTEGTTINLVLDGAGDEQLSWVFERYPGGDFQVPFRVALAGIYANLEGVTVYEEFVATFADYNDSSNPFGE